jgi:hypothetical protein
MVKKKPGNSGLSIPNAEELRLLNFGLFVHHVLTDYRIKFFDLHFFWHGALIFIGSVKMTGSGTGYEFNFIAHFNFLFTT